MNEEIALSPNTASARRKRAICSTPSLDTYLPYSTREITARLPRHIIRQQSTFLGLDTISGSTRGKARFAKRTDC